MLLPVAVLAIWKANAVYLPLDPTYPPVRLTSMASRAQAVLILSESAVEDRVSGIERRSVPRPRCAALTSADLEPSPGTFASSQAAYVIFTSGSTGRPKGVAVTHNGVASLAAAQNERFAISAGDRLLAFATPSFDASISELVTTLTAGATLAFIPDSERTGDWLARWLTRSQVTHATLAPSV